MNQEMKLIVNEILDETSRGSVTGWSNRLGELAKAGCVKCELINWYQSPKSIATDIVIYSINNNSIDMLKCGIKNYRYETQN